MHFVLINIIICKVVTIWTVCVCVAVDSFIDKEEPCNIPFNLRTLSFWIYHGRMMVVVLNVHDLSVVNIQPVTMHMSLFDLNCVCVAHGAVTCSHLVCYLICLVSWNVYLILERYRFKLVNINSNFWYLEY